MLPVLGGAVLGAAWWEFFPGLAGASVKWSLLSLSLVYVQMSPTTRPSLRKKSSAATTMIMPAS